MKNNAIEGSLQHHPIRIGIHVTLIHVGRHNRADQPFEVVTAGGESIAQGLQRLRMVGFAVST